MEKKQSSIEQKVFQSSLDLLLYYLPSAIRGQFKEQIKQAKATHRKEILEARQNGLDNGFTNGCWDSNLYYEEEFGGNNE